MFFQVSVCVRTFFDDPQEGVAIEIAEAVVGALKGELAATAVNAPMVPAEVITKHEYSPHSSLLQNFIYFPFCFVKGF